MSEQNKKIIAGLHRKDLTNIKFASALLDMAIEEKKDDLNFALQQAKEVQQIAARESRKKNSIEFATLYWKATLMLAPYFFEDFLYYMEKDRAPDKRFYMPRRRTLKVVVDDLQDLEDGKLDFYGLSMPPRVGKSTICIFFMAWVMGKRPNSHNAMSGHSGILADGFYGEALNLMELDVPEEKRQYHFLDIFPQTFLQKKSAEKKEVTLNDPDRFATLTCRGIDGTWTGAVDISWDGYLYVDDMVRDRPIMGVSYITDQNGNSTYGCYTEDTYYEVENIIKMTKEKKRAKWFVSNGNGRKNIPAAIPIVEYINDYDRMGCFERVISEIDALNIVTSDRVNDIVQCVQSLLWVHNAELPKDENGNSTVRNGALIETKSTGNGHDPKMAYLSKEMSQDGIQTLIQNFIDRIHEKTNVPGRQEQGGGSTGSAMNLSNGWQAAELSALKKSQLTKKSEKECIRIMLEIFNNDVDVPEEVRNLKLADIEPKFDRNRTYDLATKVNSWATLIQNGADLLKATELAGFTTDAQQFVLDSEEMVNKLLESKLKGSEPVDTASEGKVNDSDEQTTMDGKNMPDMSDQPQATPFANA